MTHRTAHGRPGLPGRHYDATVPQQVEAYGGCEASDIGAMILLRAWERAGNDVAFLTGLG